MSKAQLSSLILNIRALPHSDTPSLHRDPVDGHRAADLAAPATPAAALTGIVALGDVVLVNPGNEAGVRPPAAIL